MSMMARTNTVPAPNTFPLELNEWLKISSRYLFKPQKFGKIEKNDMCDHAQRLVNKLGQRRTDGIEKNSEWPLSHQVVWTETDF